MAHIPYDDLMKWKRLPKPVRDKVSTPSLEEEAVENETQKELAKILGPAITRRIERVLTTLSPNEGFIVLARDLLNMRNDELASLLYKTEGNVRKAYSQGKSHLGEDIH